MRRWKVPIALGVLALGAVTGVRATLATQSAADLTALDYAQIEQLYAHYNHYVDSAKDEGRAFADLFTPDGILDTGSPALGKVQGTAALTRFARTVGAAAPTIRASHYVTSIMIDPSPEGATGSAYLLMITSPQEGKSAAGLSAIYTDTLVRTPGGWRFKTRAVNPVTPQTDRSAREPGR
jgi:hypothetical protein